MISSPLSPDDQVQHHRVSVYHNLAQYSVMITLTMMKVTHTLNLHLLRDNEFAHMVPYNIHQQEPHNLFCSVILHANYWLICNITFH